MSFHATLHRTRCDPPEPPTYLGSPPAARGGNARDAPKSRLFLRGAQMSRIMPAPWPGGPSRLFVVGHG